MAAEAQHRAEETGAARKSDAAYQADILRKREPTSLNAGGTGTVRTVSQVHAAARGLLQARRASTPNLRSFFTVWIDRFTRWKCTRATAACLGWRSISPS